MRELAAKLVGTDDFTMRVTSTSPWTVNHHFATTIASGRVFCAGDAVQRPPSDLDAGSGRARRIRLWTVIGGQVWIDAAAAFQAETPLALTIVSIGPGQPIEDPYGTWTELSEITDAGVLLVRPDLYVAARHATAPSSAAAAGDWLRDALIQIVGAPAPS